MLVTVGSINAAKQTGADLNSTFSDILDLHNVLETKSQGAFLSRRNRNILSFLYVSLS